MNPTTIVLTGDDGSTITLTPADDLAITIGGAILGPQGNQGIQGPAGINGTNGTNGQGVPTGGTANEVLVKNSGTDYDTSWEPLPPATSLELTDSNGVNWLLSVTTYGALVTSSTAGYPATYGASY